MKRNPKVYLDTSVLSALFDDKNPERKNLTRIFFNQTENFQIFISDLTLAEIERTVNVQLKRKLQKLVDKFDVVKTNEDVERVAEEYIKQGAVPEGYPEDAYHIALAVIYEMDYLLSWNFRHIVRKRTIDVIRMVNTLHGLRQVEIMAPPEIL
ncbi:unnamed protein product [marine sediment metagenome]|uniref:PIN domain-containing protein n=1 Tax=marine sediment metagenome TaxID=412755 RepID=X1C216_9ZZZZ